MPRSGSAIVLAALAAMVLPLSASAERRPPEAFTLIANTDSASARAEFGAYEFPSARRQLRTWAMNATGPWAVAGNFVGASWRHWATDEPAEWDTDARGLARRFGTASLSTFIGETTLSLSSAALRQDANYYRCPRTGFGPRARHAVAMAFMARDPQGNAVFSPGKTFSPFVGPVIVVTAFYPGAQSWKGGLLSGAYGLLINAGWNAAREFVVQAPPWRSGRPPGGLVEGEATR